MKLSKTKIRIPLILLLLMLMPAASFGMAVGEKAPPFSGNSTQGVIASADFIGKKNVVLALYFAVFTPV
jgi:hypothetical protein